MFVKRLAGETRLSNEFFVWYQNIVRNWDWFLSSHCDSLGVMTLQTVWPVWLRCRHCKQTQHLFYLKLRLATADPTLLCLAKLCKQLINKCYTNTRRRPLHSSAWGLRRVSEVSEHTHLKIQICRKLADWVKLGKMDYHRFGMIVAFTHTANRLFW